MQRPLSERVLWELELQENSSLSASDTARLSANADLIGETYHCQDAVVRVVSIDPMRPEKYVIVQDLRTEKRWSAPAGIIRLALGGKRGRRKKAA
jgi:hypothetical protein